MTLWFLPLKNKIPKNKVNIGVFNLGLFLYFLGAKAIFVFLWGILLLFFFLGGGVGGFLGDLI
jgi:hypothetical protein